MPSKEEEEDEEEEEEDDDDDELLGEGSSSIDSCSPPVGPGPSGGNEPGKQAGQQALHI